MWNDIQSFVCSFAWWESDSRRQRKWQLTTHHIMSSIGLWKMASAVLEVRKGQRSLSLSSSRILELSQFVRDVRPWKLLRELVVFVPMPEWKPTLFFAKEQPNERCKHSDLRKQFRPRTYSEILLAALVLCFQGTSTQKSQYQTSPKHWNFHPWVVRSHLAYGNGIKSSEPGPKSLYQIEILGNSTWLYCRMGFSNSRR
jgi:hypothetical protein